MIGKKKLNFLFNEKKLTPYEISEIYNFDLCVVRSRLSELGITPTPKKRKYELIRKTHLSQDQKSFFIGELLSHAIIKKHGKNNLQIIIKDKNKDRMLWKKIIVGNLVNVINKQKSFYSFAIIHHELKFLKDLFYDNNKKIISENIVNHISELSLAIWFMNCAITKDKSTIRFSGKFSKKDLEMLQYILKFKFNIRSKVCEYDKHNKKYYYLSINKRNSEILVNLIKPFIDDYEEYFTIRSSTTETPNSRKGDDTV